VLLTFGTGHLPAPRPGSETGFTARHQTRLIHPATDGYPHGVIVVIGSPIGRFADDVIVAGGMASRIALAAAGSGRVVQLVGRTGDDPAADSVVLDLAKGGVGHVALLRDPGRATPLEPSTDGAEAIEDDAAAEATTAQIDATTAPGFGGVAPDGSERSTLDPGDVDLGLRYLTDFAVVVLAEPAEPETVAIVADAAGWAEARMILVLASGAPVPDSLPVDAVVFEAPDADPDGVFAALVGHFAAALDDGAEPGEAFRTSVATDGWSGATPD
jgi:hypothetical protein